MPTGKNLNLTGQRFGYLTVLRKATRHEKQETGADHHSFWWVRCDCGVERLAMGKRLVNGVTKICARNGHRMDNYDVLGLQRKDNSPGYRSWECMKERCRNPNHKAYANYGARGISVCARWIGSFDAFIADMGPPPSPEHTIERNDVNGHYEPDNCRWATLTEQTRNKRSTVFVEYGGQRRKLIDLCEQLGVKRSKVYGRLKLGWPIERAIAS